MVAAEKLTRIEHSVRILSTIRAAEADGNAVYITNMCCGCSRMSLVIGSGEYDAHVEIKILDGDS